MQTNRSQNGHHSLFDRLFSFTSISPAGIGLSSRSTEQLTADLKLSGGRPYLPAAVRSQALYSLLIISLLRFMLYGTLTNVWLRSLSFGALVPSGCFSGALNAASYPLAVVRSRDLLRFGQRQRDALDL